MKLARFLLLGALSSSFLWASTKQVRVSGQCWRDTPADRARLLLTHVTRDPDIKVASQKNSQKYEKLRKSIESLKLAKLELKTVEYSVNELREWEKDRMVSRGFESRISLEISSSEVEKMGEVIRLAADQRVQDVGQLNTYVSRELLEKERLACLEEAVANAQKKAQALVKNLGASLGGVLEIHESFAADHPRPQPVFKMARSEMAAATDAAPQIEAGKETLNFEVTVVFSIR